MYRVETHSHAIVNHWTAYTSYNSFVRLTSFSSVSQGVIKTLPTKPCYALLLDFSHSPLVSSLKAGTVRDFSHDVCRKCETEDAGLGITLFNEMQSKQIFGHFVCMNLFGHQTHPRV